MSLTIKEVVIKATVGSTGNEKDQKEKEDTTRCGGDKAQTQATQDAVDMVSNMLKNEKER